MTASLRDGASLTLGGGAGPDNYANYGGLYVPPSVAPAIETLQPENPETETSLAQVVEMNPGTLEDDTEELPTVVESDRPNFNHPVAVAMVPRPEPTTIRVKAHAPQAPARPKAVREQGPDSQQPSTLMRVWHALAGQKIEADVSKAAVIIAGTILLPVAVIAFALSFQITLPLIKSGGWSGGVAVSGPLFLDAAASAAAIFGLLSQHHLFVRSGRLLLVLATVLSVWMNMDGHALHRRLHPESTNSQALMAFGIAVPVVLAILIHLFGTALGVYLQQKHDREKQAKEEKREEEERQRRVEEASASLPTPRRKGEGVTKEIALAYGVAYEVHQPAALRDRLTDAGYKAPSKTSLRNWCKEIRDVLRIADGE